MYRKYLKRLFDFVFATIAFLLLSPLFIVIVLLLFIFNGGSVFFKQARPGYNGEVFTLIKFKTMNDKKDANGILLPDRDRLTALGKFIRRTSLDELPQLLNVIAGHMSLIGPRPLLVEYLPLYNLEERRRHDVRPGITGWAQVNGRNAISWKQKFAYDLYYVDHLNFSLDLKILCLTFAKVFKSEGVNASDTVTMEKFKGH